jgi:hypothetical protein
MLSSSRAGVTGIYATCKDWHAVLLAASAEPRLRHLVKAWHTTHHAGSLNAIMTNATMAVWIAYHTGRCPDGLTVPQEESDQCNPTS